MGRKKLSFRFVLTGSFLSVLILFALLILISFAVLFSTTSTMQDRINRYMELDAMTKNIELCRQSFETYFTHSDEASRRMAAAELRGGFANVWIVLGTLGEPSYESGEAYFIHRAIQNGLSYLEERCFDVPVGDYVGYYWLLDVFSYLEQYSAGDYLTYTITHDAAASRSTWDTLLRLRTEVIIATVALFLVSILFLTFFSGYMSRPIRSMATAARQLTLGNYDFPELMAEGPLELASLEESVNQMKRAIKDRDDLSKELYQESLKNIEMSRDLSTAQYHALQAQINPHFLFNVLNTLSHTAFLEKAEKSVVLTNTIASFFRYSLDFRNEVAIHDELEFCRQYLMIQQQRFGNRIQYAISCGQGLDSLFIPPVIIQPFVENAVVHGLEPTEYGGMVKIIVTDDGGHVVVLVEDNGVGVDPSDMRTAGNGRSHIGIENVRERLRVYFNDEAGVRIARMSPQGGTRVTLRFPQRSIRWV
ncbi:MAG: sensor histidine kinase [Sphaerochaetaceae bacterium]|nr:sensor histidine kinase [Sphaerochaetaceae bacterium]